MRTSKFVGKLIPRRSSASKLQVPPVAEISNVPNRLLRLIMMKHYKAATERLDFHPKEASTWIKFDDQGANKGGSSTGSLPIHVACLMLRNRSTMVEVEHLIERLIQEYPTGCECVSQNGTLPIHIACLHGASPKIVKLMLTEYPGSVDVRDESKKTPLQCAKAFRADRKRRKELIDLLKFAEKNKLGEVVVHHVHTVNRGLKPVNEMKRMENYMSKRVLDVSDDTGDNDKRQNARPTISRDSEVKRGSRPDLKKSSVLETPFRHDQKQRKFIMATLIEKSEEIKEKEEKEEKEKEETKEDLSPKIQEYKDKIKELELKVKQLTGKNIKFQVENTVLKKKNNQLMKQSLSLKMKNATNLLKLNTLSNANKFPSASSEKSDNTIQVTKQTNITIQVTKQVNSTSVSDEPSDNPQQNDQKYIQGAPSEKSDNTIQSNEQEKTSSASEKSSDNFKTKEQTSISGTPSEKSDSTTQSNAQEKTSIASDKPSDNLKAKEQTNISDAPSEKSDSTTQLDNETNTSSSPSKGIDNNTQRNNETNISEASSEKPDTTPTNQQKGAENEHDYCITDDDKDYAIYNLETQNKALMRVIGSMATWVKYIEEEKVGPQRRWRYGVEQNLDANVLNELRALLSGKIFLDAQVNTHVQATRYERENEDGIYNAETVDDYWDGDDDDDNDGVYNYHQERKEEEDWGDFDEDDEDYDDDDDDVDINDYWS